MGTSHASTLERAAAALARGQEELGAGDAGEALAQLAPARRLYLDAGDVRGAARAAIETGRALALRGEHGRAVLLLEEQRAGAPDADVAAHASLALGELTGLRPHFERAKAHFDVYWDGAALARACVGLADSEEPAAAEALLARALVDSRHADAGDVTSRVLAARARLRARQGVPQAEAAFREAIAALEKRRQGRALAETVLAFGTWLAERGDDAEPWLERAESLFRAQGALGDAARARRLMGRDPDALVEAVRLVAAEEPERRPLAVVRLVAALARADRALVALVDERGELGLSAALRMPEHDESWRQAAEAARAAPVRAGGVLAVPLARRRRLCGVLYCDKSLAGGELDDAGQDLVVAFAEQVAPFLELGLKTAALAGRVKLLSEALDAASEGLVLCTAEGRIMACNRAASRLLDLDRLERAQKDHVEAWPALAAALAGQGDEISLPGGDCHVEVRATGDPGLTRLVLLTHARVTAAPARLELVGDTPAFRRCLEAIELAAPADAPVLIAGERGSGRRLLARLTHEVSGRGDLVTFDAAGVPRGRAVAELGAALGGAGTLLITEVDELSLAAQARLTEALAPGLGPRVVATGRDLRRLSRDLTRVFRPGTLIVPPLRERLGDLPLLVEHIVPRVSAALGRSVTSVSPEVMDALFEHDWPGNVRELEELLEAAVGATAPGSDMLFEVPAALVTPREEPAMPHAVRPIGEVQHQLLVAALRKFHGNVPRVARSLGVSRGTVYNLMRKYQVDPSSFRA